MDKNVNTNIAKNSDVKFNKDNIDSIIDHRPPLEGDELEEFETVLRQTLGSETNPSTLCNVMNMEQQNRLFSLTLEMLIEHEEIDLHPYGRGGIYEGIFYRDRPTLENTNVVVVFIWLILISSIVTIAGAIVTVSELYHFLKSETTKEDKTAFCDFFKNCIKIQPFQ
ncbi:PIGA-like protein [Schistosoma japonicum]|uniref:PIGA-like protein n=1 Tax=Schistosoma japonicum TaxID=6182 RepID=A0A4Z2CUF0_SCHJA|nr:PIGA-like protein [Schistosoma japonicum]